MSSAPTSATYSSAPWRKDFLEHIDKMDSPEFVLGTVAKTQDSPLGAEPRVRFCVFRGFWGSLPPNKHNDIDKNSDAFESDCFTFTTDVRMQKCKDFFVDDSDYHASGGGAPVEAVWWVNEDVKHQWRVKGDVWVLGPDFADGEKKGPKAVKDAIAARMRVSGDEKISNFDWSKEITAHFANLTPGMRGSFKNPPPGKPVEETEKSNDELVGVLLEDNHDKVARENFRVVVIRPFHVEDTDLTDSRRSRRKQYVLDEKTGEWHHTLLWP